MAISKLNAEQFANYNDKSAGIIFVYPGKDGKNTAVHFFGPEFEATKKTQEEIIRVVKNCLFLQWATKLKRAGLMEDNAGIMDKFRASTPCEIILNTDKSARIRRYDTAGSVFAKFGFAPAKKDIDKYAKFTERERKSQIHRATIATLEALNFRVEFPKEADIQNADENNGTDENQ